MRVCTDDWFADVPSSCDWIRETSTRLSVVASSGEGGEGDGKRLEMTGSVLVRDEKRVVLSCGGLIVSVVPSMVAPDVMCHGTAVFTPS